MKENKYIVIEIHDRCASNSNGDEIYWAKVRKVKNAEKVEMYQCQSVVEGGEVKNCTCGNCF